MPLLMTKPAPDSPELKVLEKLLDKEQMPDDFVLLPLDQDLITSVLSRERIRLITWLKLHGPATSIEHIAEALDRTPSALSRDIAALEGVGLLAVEKKGRKKAVVATHRPILIV